MSITEASPSLEPTSLTASNIKSKKSIPIVGLSENRNKRKSLSISFIFVLCAHDHCYWLSLLLSYPYWNDVTYAYAALARNNNLIYKIYTVKWHLWKQNKFLYFSTSSHQSFRWSVPSATCGASSFAWVATVIIIMYLISELLNIAEWNAEDYMTTLNEMDIRRSIFMHIE